MRHIIIGAGEVGMGLHKVIGGDLHDPFKGFNAIGQYDILHICIPPFDRFIEEVKRYQDLFQVKHTCVHSSVQIGTSEKCNASHSPIRGVHPNIDLGIKTFVKYIGGKDAEIISEELNKFGITTKLMKDARTCEAGKLWDTTYYGWQIVFNKLLHKWCEENDIDFNAIYYDFNKTYNDGYRKLGREEVVRPYLKFMEGKIGGHCIINNCLLFDTEITDYILKHNSLL